MYHNLQFSKKMIVKAKYSKNLTISDFMLIMAIGAISWLVFVKLVSPILQALAPLEAVIIAYLLISPSSVYDKKNYQVLLQIIRKPRRVYHAIARPIFNFAEEKEGSYHGRI